MNYCLCFLLSLVFASSYISSLFLSLSLILFSLSPSLLSPLTRRSAAFANNSLSHFARFRTLIEELPSGCTEPVSDSVVKRRKRTWQQNQYKDKTATEKRVKSIQVKINFTPHEQYRFLLTRYLFISLSFIICDYDET